MAMYSLQSSSVMARSACGFRLDADQIWTEFLSQLIFLHLPSISFMILAASGARYIFDETYGTVLEIVLHQAGNIIVHERIDAGVIGGGGQDQLGVAESVAEGRDMSSLARS